MRRLAPRENAALLSVLALGCVTSEQTPESRLTPAGRVGKQHTAVLSLAARFYCENQRWPVSLRELRAFDEERDRIPHVPRDWPWLLGSNVRLTTDEKYQLQSEYEIEPGDIRVMRSGQDAPVGSPGTTELQNAFVNLSDDLSF